MYRKIIFIAINLLSISSFVKVTVLLIIAAFAFITSFFCEPFNYKELNKIENYSLLSAMATLFAGALYVSDINDTLKALSFVFIIMVNVIFSLNWFFSIINVVFHAHIKKFQEYFPNLTYSIVAGILTLEKTKKTYFKNFVKLHRFAAIAIEKQIGIKFGHAPLLFEEKK